MTRELKIGKHLIGDNHPCFITYEAGPTLSNLSTALSLVEEAAKSGADAIKFQIFNPDKLVVDKKQLFAYSILVNRETGELKEVSEPLYDILVRRCLSKKEWEIVKKKADELNLAFFATIGFEEDLELLKSMKCDSVKIASSDVNHFPLLRLAAQSGMNVQLDTGNSDIHEIKEAVSVLENEGCKSIIIHQCPSGYPAKLPSICLRMIKTLKDNFPKYPIAYSDHTPEADMDIAAVSLGANLVEKTITLNRMTPSVEHVFSLEPKDMKVFIERIRNLETALGSFNREITEKQKKDRKLLRRSPYTNQNVSKGENISNINVEFRRPGIGMSPIEWEILNKSNAKIKSSLTKGNLLKVDMFDVN